MAITCHEFAALDAFGNPIGPALAVTDATASPLLLSKNTGYFFFSATVAGYGVLTYASTVATSANSMQLEAGKNAGMSVKPDNLSKYVHAAIA